MGNRAQPRPTFRSADKIPLSRSSLTTKWILSSHKGQEMSDEAPDVVNQLEQASALGK